MECSLNELYNGCSKLVEYCREVLNPDGRTTSSKEETRTIQVQPGFRSGDTVSFHKLGHESAGQDSSDLIFTIEEMDHPVYKRDCHDLHLTKTISLL